MRRTSGPRYSRGPEGQNHQPRRITARLLRPGAAPASTGRAASALRRSRSRAVGITYDFACYHPAARAPCSSSASSVSNVVSPACAAAPACCLAALAFTRRSASFCGCGVGLGSRVREPAFSLDISAFEGGEPLIQRVHHPSLPGQAAANQVTRLQPVPTPRGCNVLTSCSTCGMIAVGDLGSDQDPRTAAVGHASRLGLEGTNDGGPPTRRRA